MRPIAASMKPVLKISDRMIKPLTKQLKSNQPIQDGPAISYLFVQSKDVELSPSVTT